MVFVSYCPTCNSFHDPLRQIPDGTEVERIDSEDPAITFHASIHVGGELLKGARFVRKEPDGCNRTSACGEVLVFDV